MVSWKCVPESAGAEEWDGRLLQAADANVFQSFAWGEYKRLSGWRPSRWVARDASGAVVAAAQVLVKSFAPGLTGGWAPGGPVFRFCGAASDHLASAVERLVEEVRRADRVRWLRFHSQTAGEEALDTALRRTFRRPTSCLAVGRSIRLDLAQSSDEFLKGMTAKHRYYVRKSLGEPILWQAANDARTVRALSVLYEEMVREKGLAGQPGLERDLADLCGILKERALILIGSQDDQPLVGCLVLTFGSKAFYLKAAAGQRGRALSASYAMVYRLFEQLRDRGLSELDFGGIAPETVGGEGVAHFKRGFGGEPVEYLGEWEWAGFRPVRWAMDLALRYRGRVV
jgi:hypothetical protein